VAGIDDPLRLVHLLVSLLDMKADEQQKILEDPALTSKLQLVASAMTRDIALLEMKSKIESTRSRR
jgi:ATP-dependent Lon protease